MRSRGFVLSALSCVMLVGCDPVSISYRAAQIAFMGKAEEELQQQERFQKYKEACLWPRFNALALAREAEEEKHWLNAAHYYHIAAWKGYHPAVGHFNRTKAALTPEEQTKLAERLGMHTKENIEQCWRVEEGRY